MDEIKSQNVSHESRQQDTQSLFDASTERTNLWNTFLRVAKPTKRSKTRRRTIRVSIQFRGKQYRPIAATGLLFVRVANRLKRFISDLPLTHRYPVIARFGWGVLAVLMFSTVFFEVFNSLERTRTYDISPKARLLLTESVKTYGEKLTIDTNANSYVYNQDYIPTLDGMAGQVSGPKFTGSFGLDSTQGVTVTDPTNKVSVTIRPDYGLNMPRKEQNKLFYPISGKSAVKVATLMAIGFKEDIILESYQGEQVEYSYTLDLPDGTEARLESNGSVTIYGVSNELLGNVSTGSESDAELLQNARQNGKKNNLLFTFPAPYVKELNKDVSSAKAWFTLENNRLTLFASGLKDAKYPLSIDPSIYVETAAKLMLGNNESNIDFDINNELIQKSQTTGARIDAWSSTTNLSSAVWGQGTAVAGGYVYSAGGGGAADTITTTYNVAGSSTFTVPAGVNSVTIKSWGGGGGGGAGTAGTGLGGAGGGGGYAKASITVTPGEGLTVAVGGGGAKATANGRGGTGGTASAVLRGATYLVEAGGGGGGSGRRGTSGGTTGDGGAGGGTTGQAGRSGSAGGAGGGGTQSLTANLGAAGTGGAAGVSGISQGGGNGTPTAACATAATGTGTNRSGGAGGTFVTTCAPGGGGGGGYYGGGGGGSTSTNNRTGGGGGGGSSYINPTGLVTGSDVQTQGSYQVPGNSGDTDRGGLGDGGTGATTAAGASAGEDGIIVISYTTAGVSATNNVSWAKFNTTTNAIESPNPGAGTCTGWCTNGVYDLPVALRGLSLIAYNGYLFAIGGSTSAGTPQTSVYIAKIGANGEPQLWHPTGGTPVYWYADTALTNARSYFGAVAYNNRLYIMGGLTTSSTVLSSDTVQYADIRPNGTLTPWTATGMTALSTARYGLTAQVYNDYLYVIGGNATLGGSPVTTVEYARLNNDGTMNGWVGTNTFGTGRLTLGGSFSTLFGGYIYIVGGCTTVNASGYCTAIASDVQLASINADGSLAPWNTVLGLTNDRFAHTLIAWQGGLYRLGGCRAQDAFVGACTMPVLDVDYGVINQDGDASTVSNSSAWSLGAVGGNTCSGFAEGNSSLRNCNLPDPGDNAGQGGQMTSMVVINNGYIYNIGGCTDISTTSECASGAGMSGNTSYAALNSNGEMVAPSTCSGTWDGLWCVDSTNRINGTTGVGAGAATVFNNYIYVVGGTNGNSTWYSNVYYTSINTNGSINAWTTAGTGTTGLPTTFPAVTGETGIGYGFAFARANPASAGSNPGNLYYIGGCNGTATGIGCSNYSTAVYKCNIGTAGGVSGCTTTGQMQLDADNVNTGSQGLGLMAGALYANRLYLVGGSCGEVGADPDAPCGANFAANRRDTIYAKIDNTNNIVDNTTGLSTGSWTFTSGQMDPVRRRAVSFGYNGYIYSLAGYSGSVSLQDLLFAKIDVSTGDMGAFSSSGVVVTPRWDLRAIVSNGYVYAIGGCGTGTAPAGCTDMQEQIQTFQLYNNDSGSPVGYSASANLFPTDRLGVSSAVLNGYLYVAGGCTVMSAGVCTTADSRVDFAPIDVYGNVGAWGVLTDATLPDVRVFGQLEAVGGTLYYIGGQNSAGTVNSTVYYATPSTLTGDTTSWNVATQGLPATRSEVTTTVWNNRIYALGGRNNSGSIVNTVYASPDLSAGGDITSAWTATGMTAFNVARSGATAVAYANNLYIMGGYTGSVYLSDVQFAKIASDGTVGAWTYSTSLPEPIRQADGFAVNGYMYLVGGRSSDTNCVPNTLVAPISANTTIASGNNPTGVGDWYETNQKYTGDRYGASATYYNGKAYVIGGGCGASGTLTGANRVMQTAVYSQPQIAKYSIMFNTDSNVFPYTWLLNGLDNSIGARWGLKYRSAVGPANVVSHEGFDNGTNGAVVTEFNTLYENCYTSGGGSVLFSNAQYITPNLSLRAATSGSAGRGACYDVYSMTQKRYDRFYLRFDSLASLSNNVVIAEYSKGLSTLSQLRITTTGTLQLRDLFTAEATSTALSANTWYRIETSVDNDRMALRIFSGTNLNGTVPNQSYSISLDNAAFNDFDATSIGIQENVNSGWGIYIDEHEASSSSWIGPAFSGWGQETNFGNVTLGTPGTYTPLNEAGTDTEFARYYYLTVSIDSSQAFGYPEDVTRGPTISDLTLQFTSDPNKRLMHGRTFIGGLQQPDDTPCRAGSGYAACTLP